MFPAKIGGALGDYSKYLGASIYVHTDEPTLRGKTCTLSLSGIGVLQRKPFDGNGDVVFTDIIRVGTYRVESSNGENSNYSDVVCTAVDICAKAVLSTLIVLAVFLYKDGDQCSALTGGWYGTHGTYYYRSSRGGYWISYQNKDGYPKFNATNIEIKASSSGYPCALTRNLTDFLSGYHKLHILFANISAGETGGHEYVGSWSSTVFVATSSMYTGSNTSASNWMYFTSEHCKSVSCIGNNTSAVDYHFETDVSNLIVTGNATRKSVGLCISCSASSSTSAGYGFNADPKCYATVKRVYLT